MDGMLFHHNISYFDKLSWRAYGKKLP